VGKGGHRGVNLGLTHPFWPCKLEWEMLFPPGEFFRDFQIFNSSRIRLALARTDIPALMKLYHPPPGRNERRSPILFIKIIRDVLKPETPDMAGFIFFWGMGYGYFSGGSQCFCGGTLAPMYSPPNLDGVGVSGGFCRGAIARPICTHLGLKFADFVEIDLRLYTYCNMSL